MCKVTQEIKLLGVPKPELTRFENGRCQLKINDTALFQTILQKIKYHYLNVQTFSYTEHNIKQQFILFSIY